MDSLSRRGSIPASYGLKYGIDHSLGRLLILASVCQRSLALGNPDQTIAGDDGPFGGHDHVAKGTSLVRWDAGIVGFGELTATSISEANSSGVKSFGAWTVIAELWLRVRAAGASNIEMKAAATGRPHERAPNQLKSGARCQRRSFPRGQFGNDKLNFRAVGRNRLASDQNGVRYQIKTTNSAISERHK